MIQLLTYAPAFDQPSASPFCVKAMMLLNMAGEDWMPDYLDDPRKMPYAKLPAIRDSGQIIADSDNIRTWCEARGTDFDAGLSDVQRSHARALIRMAEEHMYFHLVHDRWVNDAVWPVTRDTYFAMIPRPIRGIVTKGIRKPTIASLRQMGLSRFSDQDRIVRLEHDLQAIRALLSNPFLFGETPTSADASVAPILAAIMATPVPTLLGNTLRDDQILVDYVVRMREATL